MRLVGLYRHFARAVAVLSRERRHLRLSGSRRAAVHTGASGLGIPVEKRALLLAVDEIVRVGQRGLRHATEALAVVGLALLSVGGNVERDEEHQVRGENTNSGEGSEFLAGALASVGHPGEVGGSEVGPGREVDESCIELVILLGTSRHRGRLTQVNDELDDLETSDPFLPPTADTTCTLEVVPVHDDVDSQVQRDDNPGHGGAAQELGVAENRGSAMVVAVQEGCGQAELA